VEEQRKLLWQNKRGELILASLQHTDLLPEKHISKLFVEKLDTFLLITQAISYRTLRYIIYRSIEY